MVTVEQWFETKDYGIGLALLAKNSKNRYMLQQLSRRHNPVRLEYELKKIAHPQALNFDEKKSSAPVQRIKDQAIDLMNAEMDAQAESVATGKLKVVRNNREINFEDLPKNLQEKWSANRDWYKQIRSYHEKLKLMENASADDRSVLTTEIVKLDEQIKANWEIIDTWDPDQVNEELPSKIIDHKRINSNRKFISTNLKALKDNPDDAKVLAIMEKIQERYSELKAAGEVVSQETIEEMKRIGINC